MPRLFIVFRTYDTIWSCKTYTKELSPFEFDRTSCNVKLMFSVVPVSFKGKDDHPFHHHTNENCPSLSKQNVEVYCNPHRYFKPCILNNKSTYKSGCCSTSISNNDHLLGYSLTTPQLDMTSKCPSVVMEENVFYVLPRFKCTIVLDAHLSSAISDQLVRSRPFRKRFLRYVKSYGGFRDCLCDYEGWTEEEKQIWDNYLSVPLMIDIVAVWSQQKIDYPWLYKIQALLNMYISLEEGFAWLSTLGGAHSALGELFLEHAEEAGNISKQQLKVAKLLGNYPMMARCYIFYSWSLIQKWELRKGRKCIRNVWTFCKTLQVKDFILENMCKAVWSRLRYRRSLFHGGKHGSCEPNSGNGIQSEHSKFKATQLANKLNTNHGDTDTTEGVQSVGNGKNANSLPGLRNSSPVTVQVF